MQKHVKQSIMTEFQEKVLKLIEEGKSPSEIKRLLNCPRTSITSVLKAYMCL